MRMMMGRMVYFDFKGRFHYTCIYTLTAEKESDPGGIPPRLALCLSTYQIEYQVNFIPNSPVPEVTILILTYEGQTDLG